MFGSFGPSKTKSASLGPYDLVVVGGGVVGVVAAVTAASSPFSKKVALVDAPRASGMLMNEATGEDLSLGGPTGLFSKALRDTSKRIKVSTLRGMGLREDSVWNEIISSCVDLASSNANDIRRQLDMCNVDYVQGFASFPDSGGTRSLFISKQDGSSQTLSTDNILVATGSKPFLPGGIPFDGVRIFDSDSINTLSYLPKSIAITGYVSFLFLLCIFRCPSHRGFNEGHNIPALVGCDPSHKLDCLADAFHQFGYYCR
jgi:NAD(P) transhydrogenase